MATVTTKVSDLSGEGGDDVRNVEFSILGAEYEVDLTGKELAAFQKMLEKYTAVARRTVRSTAASYKAAAKSDAKEVRAWLEDNGYEVPARGRIPGNLREAYESGTPAK